jgi:hypothetical protein
MTDSLATSLSWRKSSASASGDCVEVALANGAILVRDSKQRRSYILEFTSSEWGAFLYGVRAGEFDLENLKHGGESR